MSTTYFLKVILNTNINYKIYTLGKSTYLSDQYLNLVCNSIKKYRLCWRTI